MTRKLFCEISPLCYKISSKKEILKRRVKNVFGSEKIAKGRAYELLPNIVKSHSSILIRKLHRVDIKLQENKVTNIILASEKINKIIIKPGETFSYWTTVGKTTEKEGNDYYRISKVYRAAIDRTSNKELYKELILDNHSKVKYDHKLIPKE